MITVFSIVFYDNSGESSPQVKLYLSEDDAIASVVADVANFRSLHEDVECPLDDEVLTSLKEEGLVSFVSVDGIEYSWKIDSHPVAVHGGKEVVL